MSHYRHFVNRAACNEFVLSNSYPSAFLPPLPHYHFILLNCTFYCQPVGRPVSWQTSQ